MLRAEAHHGRLAHETRQPLFVTWWKTIVAAGNDVVQFVERIAVRTPRLALLVRDEQIAVPVEREGVGHSNARREGLQRPVGEVPLLNRAAQAVPLLT